MTIHFVAPRWRCEYSCYTRNEHVIGKYFSSSRAGRQASTENYPKIRLEGLLRLMIPNFLSVWVLSMNVITHITGDKKYLQSNENQRLFTFKNNNTKFSTTHYRLTLPKTKTGFLTLFERRTGKRHRVSFADIHFTLTAHHCTCT